MENVETQRATYQKMGGKPRGPCRSAGILQTPHRVFLYGVSRSPAYAIRRTKTDSALQINNVIRHQAYITIANYPIMQLTVNSCLLTENQLSRAYTHKKTSARPLLRLFSVY